MAKNTTKPVAVVDEAHEEIPTFDLAERMALSGQIADLRESDVEDLLDERIFPKMQEMRNGRPTGRMVSSMVTTWVHAAEQGRMHHVTQVLGWRPVLSKWLKGGTMSGAWSTSAEGWLTRGE